MARAGRDSGISEVWIDRSSLQHARGRGPREREAGWPCGLAGGSDVAYASCHMRVQGTGDEPGRPTRDAMYRIRVYNFMDSLFVDANPYRFERALFLTDVSTVSPSRQPSFHVSFHSFTLASSVPHLGFDVFEGSRPPHLSPPHSTQDRPHAPLRTAC